MRRRGLTGRRGAVVAGILLLALVLRLVDAYYERTAFQGTDASGYVSYAHSIALGHGFPASPFAGGGGPSAALPPLYPYLLGALGALVHHPLQLARVIQAVAGTATVAMLGWLALLTFGELAGLITLGVAAVYPPLVLAGATTLSEAAFLPLEVAALLIAALTARRGLTLRWLVLTGFVVGLATLARPVGLVLLLPVALMTWPRAGRWSVALRARLVPVATVSAICALTVSPWLVRDALTFHHFVPVTIEDGYQLAGIMNDESRTSDDPGGFYPPNLTERYGPVFRDRHLGEYATNERLRHLALQYLGDHPGYLLKILGLNVVRAADLGSHGFEVSQPIDYGLHTASYRLARYAFWLLALVVALMALTRRLRHVPAWIWTGAVAFGATVVVNAAFPRYRWPVDVFLILLAGAGIDGWVTTSGRFRRDRIAAVRAS